MYEYTTSAHTDLQSTYIQYVYISIQYTYISIQYVYLFPVQ
jgi:hypothetical protein